VIFLAALIMALAGMMVPAAALVVGWGNYVMKVSHWSWSYPLGPCQVLELNGTL